MNPFARLSTFQLVLLSAFGLFALIGLVVLATSKNLGNGTNIGTVTIWGTLPQAAVNQEIQAITTTDKSYSKVTYVQQPEGTFDEAVANAIASGEGPNLLLINQEQLISEEDKINVIPFSSIPQRTFATTYLPEDQLYLTTNGTYGIPYVVDPLVLYYNETLLTQAGIATPPASWEAVTGVAPSLTHLQNNLPVQSAIALGTYSNIEDARGILSLLFMQAGSTITQLSNTGLRSTLGAANSNTLTGVSSVAAALNFYTQFSDPTRTVYSWSSTISSAQQAFTANTLALYVGYASERPIIAAANPNLSFTMAPIPQPQTASLKADYGLAYAFVIPKAAQNQTGAYLTAQKLADPAYLGPAAQALSMAPANRTILTASSSDEYEPVYFPAALIASGWLSPDPSVTDTIFSDMITSIASDKLNATDAVNAADQALDIALPSGTPQ
jgi:ABC-type glycerol-3-phosphate transport system substrate-binding protein